MSGAVVARLAPFLIGSILLALFVNVAAAAPVRSTTFVGDGRATPQQLRSDAASIKARLSSLGYGATPVHVTKGAIVIGGGPGNAPPKVVHDVTIIGNVYFRPVLCFAPPENASEASMPSSVSTTPLPSCSPTDTVVPMAGSIIDAKQPQNDPTFANEAKTSPRTPGYSERTVLLSGSGPTSQRYVLGPSQMSGSAIARARASRDQTGQWVVKYTTTSDGAAVWNSVAKNAFHSLLAVEVDGVVISAPLIEPSQLSFTSFGNQGAISGNLTKDEARQLGLAMNSRPLAVPLEVP
jgi:hypothetical protein